MTSQPDHSAYRLSAGISDFATIIRENICYVDKTPFIKTVLQDSSQVLLITRPGRFGKTLALRTLAAFLRTAPNSAGRDTPDTAFQDALFARTAIYEDKAFCAEFMGRYPVLSLSFRNVDGGSFQEAYAMLAGAISKAASQHQHLLDSPRLAGFDKKKLAILLDDDELAASKNRATLCNSLSLLAAMLLAHYGRRAVVLIDDCDAPLANAGSEGYGREMRQLLRSVLSTGLKDNSALKKGVLTGILNLPEESIFTGFNNLKVNTAASDIGVLAEDFGFTLKEVSALLAYYGLTDQEEAVREWYGGYRIAGRELLCPCDVIAFCCRAWEEMSHGRPVSAPENFWPQECGGNVLRKFMSRLGDADAGRMQTLLDGGEISFTLNEQLSLDEAEDLQCSEDFWTLLFSYGCLTGTPAAGDGRISLAARLPNKELRAFFARTIARCCREAPAMAASADEIAAALLAGDAAKAGVLIGRRLKAFVAADGTADRAYDTQFFLRFLSGVLSAGTREFFVFQAGREGDDGCADIVFSSEYNTQGVVIKLKAASAAGSLAGEAAEVLAQMAAEKCAAAFGQGIKKVCCSSIVFCRRTCFVQCKSQDVQDSRTVLFS